MLTVGTWLACGPKVAPSSWTATVAADHALVGRIWDGARFIGERELLAGLRDADFVLLGEKHDNPDHHHLQGRLVAALDPPAVAFEMLDTADPVDATGAEALRAAVGWDGSGWPPFELYRPVFEATFVAGARIVAANPARDDVRTVMSDGFEAVDTEGLRLDRHLTDDARSALEAEIVASHCGHASPHVVEAMVRAQVYKDATMARALTEAGRGAVLVAGGGHTRRDRGVPQYLDGVVRTVRFAEVAHGVTDPAAYDEAADFLWFTPRVDDDDPCARFADELRKLGD
jgi:uncharacterized iron-regulated protein